MLTINAGVNDNANARSNPQHKRHRKKANAPARRHVSHQNKTTRAMIPTTAAAAAISAGPSAPLVDLEVVAGPVGDLVGEPEALVTEVVGTVAVVVDAVPLLDLVALAAVVLKPELAVASTFSFFKVPVACVALPAEYADHAP